MWFRCQVAWRYSRVESQVDEVHSDWSRWCERFRQHAIERVDDSVRVESAIWRAAIDKTTDASKVGKAAKVKISAQKWTCESQMANCRE
jgi:hypothetical protein